MADSGDNTTIRRISPRGEVRTWAGRTRNAGRGTWPGAHLDLEDVLGLAVKLDGAVCLTENRSGFVPTAGGGSYANFGLRPRVVRRIRADGTEAPWAGSPTEPSYRDAARPMRPRPTRPGFATCGAWRWPPTARSLGWTKPTAWCAASRPAAR